MAFASREIIPGGLVHHTDRGTQYACGDYIDRLLAAHIQPSMSRAGCPYDNAMAESFMKTLKTEEVDASDYRDLAHATSAIGGFIEAVYTAKRLHSALDYLSPTEFETCPTCGLPRSSPHHCSPTTVPDYRVSPMGVTPRPWQPWEQVSRPSYSVPEIMPLTHTSHLVIGALVAAAVMPPAALAQPAASTVSFGGRSVTIDLTSCSPDNSADGKSRAIAAIQSRSASIAMVQFSTLNPPSGAYLTVDDSDRLGAGKVVLGLGGDAFGDVFVAKPGQTVIVTKTGSAYRAQFSNVALVQMPSKTVSSKTVSGDFGCKP